MVTLAGLMRGITGFGGAMLMAPPLSLLIGAVPTVVTALMLETAAALVMFPDALPKINKRVLFYLTLPACFTVPIGGYLLVTLDPLIARKVISAVVAVFSLILLGGLRYSGPHRPLDLAHAGQHRWRVARRNQRRRAAGDPLSAVGARSAGGNARQSHGFRHGDFRDRPGHAAVRRRLYHALTVSAFLLCIPYLAATWLGGTLFARMSDLGVRRLALGFMFTMGVVGLLA